MSPSFRCAKTAQDSSVADLLMTSSASNSPTKLSAVGEGNSDHSGPSNILSLVVGADEELATCLLCGMLIRPGPRVFGTSAEEAVREMRFRVFCATRLTCSAGQFHDALPVMILNYSSFSQFFLY